MKYVNCSAKTAYFETFGNDSFKYLVCWNSPIDEVKSTKFSHVLH